MYGETEVSQQQGGGGGGGGGGNQANAEDLADLFELELDRMRNQYEEVQRGRREQADQELDEVMQRLRELARRQQQQNERMRAQQQNMQNQSGGGGGAEGQRRLADEAEELARQLERLSREDDRPDLEQTARDLREAADAMRQAAANARNNGVAQGSEALDELREARRLLDRNRSARLQRDASDALQRVERLADEQREMVEDVSGLSDDLRERRDAAPPLQERKEEMAEEVAELEAELDRMSREARQEQPEAARSLGTAARSIRDNQLREKLLWSRGVIQERTSEYVQSLEAVIESDIEDLRQLVQQGVDAIGETSEQRLARSLDRTADAVTALESMSERLQERLGQGQAQEGQEGQQGQPEQQGQQGQGGGGRLNPDDQRQFTRELREQVQELSELRRQLEQEGMEVGELDQVISQMGSMDRRGTIGEARGLAMLESAVIQGLKEFEFNLRRQLQLDGDQRLFLSGSDAVPDGYRELVEEYYRELARRRGGDSSVVRR